MNALPHLWAADPDQEGLPRCSPLPTATATGWIPNHQHHPVPNSPNTVFYAGACAGWPIKLSCRSGVSPTLFGKLVPGGLYGDLSGGLWGFCLYLLSVQENIGCRETTKLAERQYRARPLWSCLTRRADCRQAFPHPHTSEASCLPSSSLLLPKPDC